MKKLLLGTASLLVLAIFILPSQTSCTKENINNIAKTDTVFQCTPSIKGLWIGTDAIDGQSNLGNLYWSPIIKPDGSLVVETKWTGGEQHFSSGNWTLTGDSIKGTYTCVYGLPQHIGNVQSFKGIWNKTDGKISGTWQNVGQTGGGTFVATKIN